MKPVWIEKPFKYDGSQLRSLYSYLNHGILGDSIIAWRGPCDVKPEHMADGEDLRENSAIRGDDMIHFLVEKFQENLTTAVAMQRLLASVIKDEIEHMKPQHRGLLRREGDDLFRGDRKLTISIATVSPVSALIHFAINVTNAGTPVPTTCLEDLGVEPEVFGRLILENFTREVAGLMAATRKVLWAR